MTQRAPCAKRRRLCSARRKSALSLSMISKLLAGSDDQGRALRQAGFEHRDQRLDVRRAGPIQLAGQAERKVVVRERATRSKAGAPRAADVVRPVARLAQANELLFEGLQLGDVVPQALADLLGGE